MAEAIDAIMIGAGETGPLWSALWLGTVGAVLISTGRIAGAWLIVASTIALTAATVVECHRTTQVRGGGMRGMTATGDGRCRFRADSCDYSNTPGRIRYGTCKPHFPRNGLIEATWRLLV